MSNILGLSIMAFTVLFKDIMSYSNNYLAEICLHVNCKGYNRPYNIENNFNK